MYTKMIILVIFSLIANYIYHQYRQSEEMFETNEHYQLVSEYFLEKGNRKQPILWIHTSTEINSRNWESFFSRNSTKLNQPYLQITMKSIFDKCKDSFNICLINDESFSSLLSWNIHIDDLADPIKSHYRRLGLSMLLEHYGGIVVPQSFLCTQDLKPLLEHSFFVFENKNKGVTHDQRSYLPDTFFMGCKKRSKMMERLVNYQEDLYKDKTEQSDFIGNISLWLNRHKITVLDGSFIGLKKMDTSPVTLQEILGSTDIELPKHYGIYIPQDEIINRPKYSWFARMSTEQILESSLLFSKLVKKSYKID
jgi:hypothetical protein